MRFRESKLQIRARLVPAGLYLMGDFRKDGGHTGFDFCEAKKGKGGGLCVERGSLIQSAGNLDITRCKAGSTGSCAGFVLFFFLLPWPASVQWHRYQEEQLEA